MKQSRVLTSGEEGEIYRYLTEDDPLIPTGNGPNQPIRMSNVPMIYCHYCGIKLHYMSLAKHIKTFKHLRNRGQNTSS